MVLNLFRLSKYLRSNWPVVTCDFFCVQNPIWRLVELASEHSRLLGIFVIKKYGSRPRTLKFECSDMPCQHDSGTNRVSLAFLVPEWFKSIADRFYKSGLFFQWIYFFPFITTRRVNHALNSPNFGVCVGSTPWPLVSLWKCPQH